MLLCEKVFLARCACGGEVEVVSYGFAVAVRALLVYDRVTALFYIALCLGLAFLASPLAAYPQHVNRRKQRAVQIWFVGLYIAVQTRINPPLYYTKRLVEERGQAIADRVVEVVAEDELVAADVLFGSEGEGDGVAVVGMLRGGEVGRCGG